MEAADPFFSDYAQAVQAMHELPDADGRNWRNQALIHLNHCKHGAIDFTHWHRWYLSFYEQICGVLIGKPDFALAYWDWRGDLSKVPDSFFDVDRLNVTFWRDKSDAQSDNWSPAEVTTVGVRGIARGQTMVSMPQFSRAFLPSTLDGILAQTQFNIFTGLLEGQPHNTAHVAVGSSNGADGHMGDGMSPLDPVFWLHHCNVDRFWAEWQAAGNVTDDPKNSYADNFYDAQGKPISEATSTGALSIAAFGYNYDTLEPALVADIAAQLDLKDFGSPGNSEFAGLAIAAPATIASKDAAGPAIVNIAKAIPVEVPDLIRTLFQPRLFQAPRSLGVPRKSVETARVLARFDDVRPPENRDVVVGVFVNCPYLSPSTPTDDPLCAGVFSFFGPGGAHAGHGGRREFYVDLTETLQTLAEGGRLAAGGFTVQLMPVPVSFDVPSDTSVAFKGVTILSA